MPRKQSVSPSIKIYGPVALSRDIAVDRQVKWDEQTIKWGPADDLPLRIMDAVNKSQTATSCLDTLEAFMGGSGFTDEGLMSHPIDEKGTTLWDFHCQTIPYLAKLEAHSVNFKFDHNGKITNAFVTGTESCRFVRPIGKSKNIGFIKFNPYFGTAEDNKDFTSVFPVFDIEKVIEQVKNIDDEYNGQMYFFGTVRPPYKFYPVPKYWSGEEWIYVDAGIKTFHKTNMENGFFQSTLINMIGNPNQPSSNPKYMTEVTGTDTTKRKKSTVTVGQEFDEQMSSAFSGVRKAGTAMVLWSLNKDQAVNIQGFPVTANFDLLAGTYNDAIKGICTATGIDPILLTIQNNGLANAGDSVRAVIEYTQSKVSRQQKYLENFYNKTMLPNMQKSVKQEVKIKNYSPIATSVVVDDKYWNVLSDVEKKDFVKQNIKGMSEVIKEPEIIIDENTGEPITPAETLLNEAISKMSGIDVIRIRSIGRQYDKGELTFEQARLLLKGRGLSDADVNTWLGVEAPEE